MTLLVVVPTHRRPHELRRALASVAAQRRAPDRVVVVGQDESDLEDARRDHPWVEFRHNRRTPGPSGSDNTALIDAREDMVAFLDDDDWWEPDHLEHAAAALADADVAYSGLVRHERTGPEPQPIPPRLAIDDFLVGNPGVQASNLALRIDAYWRAGGFDEWLPSTMDRDLLVRLLELPGLRTARIDRHSVHHAVHGHPRLSDPGSPAKILGLHRFERKHRHRMSDDVLARFRDRARTLFAWDGVPPSDAGRRDQRPRARRSQPRSGRGENHRPLVVGFSAASCEGAQRTLDGLDWLVATGARIHDVVVIGHTPTAARNGAPARFALHALRGPEIDARAADGRYGVAHLPEEARTGIAFARTVVHHEVYARMPDDAVAWILDDDLDLRDLRWDGQAIDGVGLMQAVAELEAIADVAVGGIHGDPPLRAGASVRTALVDLVHAADGGAGIARDGADLYHDLSTLRSDHLETPLPLAGHPSTAAAAIAAGRPAVRQAPPRLPYGDPPTRGGNTLVFASECLREHPNASPWLGDGLARRGDSLWLLQLRDLGPSLPGSAVWRVRAAPLSVAQRRLADNPASVGDLALDIDGWAFVRAMERAGWPRAIDATWSGRFAAAFSTSRRERLGALRAGALRVQGLCDVLEARHPALAALAGVERLRRDFSPAAVDRLSAAEPERIAEAIRFVGEYAAVASSYRAALPLRRRRDASRGIARAAATSS